MKKEIIKLIKEIKDSADIQYKIFTQGSCFRLYRILKIVYKDAEAYWSDRDNHAIVKIKNNFYDIGGIIDINFVEARGYYKIPKNQLRGYKIMKWIENNEPLSVEPEKYIR